MNNILFQINCEKIFPDYDLGHINKEHISLQNIFNTDLIDSVHNQIIKYILKGNKMVKVTDKMLIHSHGTRFEKTILLNNIMALQMHELNDSFMLYIYFKGIEAYESIIFRTKKHRDETYFILIEKLNNL